MATKTFERAGGEYQEPRSDQLVLLSKEAWETREEQFKYRVKAIIGEVLVVEPRQEGVVSYPPVQVEAGHPIKPRDTNHLSP